MQFIHVIYGLIYVLCGLLILRCIVELIHCLVIYKVWDKILDACYRYDCDRIEHGLHCRYFVINVCSKHRMEKSYNDLRMWRRKDVLTTLEYFLLQPYF